VRRVVRRSDLRGIIARLVRRPYDGGWPGRRVGLRGDTTRAPSQGPRPKGGRHDAALSFPFGIGTKAANRCHLVECSVYLISRPRFLHFTLNHYNARVSLVAEEGGRVVGHVLFSDLAIVTKGGTIEALSLAPLAVVPERQRRGIGSMLVRGGLRVCEESGHRIVVVLGHPEFYPRFGFSAKMAERLSSPYSGPAFMAAELVPSVLRGVTGEVVYPPPFGEL